MITLINSHYHSWAQADKAHRVTVRQQQRALQRQASLAQEHQEREQLVYMPDSPIPMRVVLPSSSVPNCGGFSASGSFLVSARHAFFCLVTAVLG